MDKPNLIIFKFNTLYEVLKELDQYLNFEIIEATNEKILQELKISSKNFLILTSKNIQGVDKQLYFDNLPIKFFKLLEKININFIKSQFNQKSELSIGKYKLNLNSRELIEENVKLKLTEKEYYFIYYLLDSKSEYISKKNLLNKHSLEFFPEIRKSFSFVFYSPPYRIVCVYRNPTLVPFFVILFLF